MNFVRTLERIHIICLSRDLQTLEFTGRSMKPETPTEVGIIILDRRLQVLFITGVTGVIVDVTLVHIGKLVEFLLRAVQILSLQQVFKL